MSMPEHYGDVSLDNIGFALKDINSDGNEELMIGTVAPVKEGGTAIRKIRFLILSPQKERPIICILTIPMVSIWQRLVERMQYGYLRLRRTRVS